MKQILNHTALGFVALLLTASPALSALSARADEVRFPLEMNQGLLEALLRERVFVGEGGRIRLQGDATGCRGLELSRPRSRIRDGRVLLRVDASASLGQVVAGSCLRIVDWRGQLEFDQRPLVGPERRSLLLQMASWRALTPRGAPDTLSTTVGHWLEQLLPAELKRIRIDLGGPFAELEALLALFLPAQDATQLTSILKSLSIREVAVLDDRIALTLAARVPRPRRPPDPGPIREPKLSAAELARLEEGLGYVDAFVTATIGQLTSGAESSGQAETLLDLLLEMRIRLVDLLGEAERRERDPVRALFVDTWDRLAEVLRASAPRQADSASALRLFTFTGGGDLLRALDALGPSVGIEVSSDGLRRLVRILIPEDSLDAPGLEEGVNPALRRALGFGEPLPLPEPEPEPQLEPESESESDDGASWLDWFVKPVRAAEALDRDLVRKLNRWVPGKSEMDAYLPTVSEVLEHVSTEQLRAKPLDSAFHREFRWLVRATAWQESCWRQFAVRKNKRVPLQSRSGDVGIMQINTRIWRGLYDVHALKWDLVYNARAGAEILQHYLVRYALRHREHETTGKPESLSRSAYAAYNGGPSQYDRYRRANASRGQKQVDRLFYEKYQQIRSGKFLAVKACFE